MGLIQFDQRWTKQPQEAIRVRPELKPIGGIQPGGFKLYDTQGLPLTIGTGVTEKTEKARQVAFSSSSTGLRRTLVGAEYPLTFVGRISLGASGVWASSIATAADRLVRVGGYIGGARAQHLGGTTNAIADAAGVYYYGTIFNVVAVFASPTDLRIYAAGEAGRSSASNTANIGALTPLTKLSFGVYDGSMITGAQDGSTEIAQWLNVAVSEKQAWQWVDNPWQLFAPRRTWVPVGAGGGGPATVTPTIITSTASIGSHTVARIAVAAVSATRIASTVSFGAATVARTAVAAVSATRIASTATFGAHTVARTGVAAVTHSRIASTVSFGTATVARTAVAAVSPTRIASTASFGSHAVAAAGMGAVSAPRIASTVTFGATTVTRAAVRSVQPGRIDSSVTFGVPVVTSSTPQIVVGRIASTAAVYAPAVVRTGPVVAASEYRRFASPFATLRQAGSAIAQTVTLASAIDLE